MTVTNTILRNDYLGNGTTTVYAFTFIVINQAGQVINPYTIQVITTDLNSFETIKTQNIDYTVQLGTDGLGTITFTTAPLVNHKITLLSNVPNTQETDYVKSGTDKFPAESHEKALDKLTLIAKQFTEKFNRIVSLSKSSTLTNIEFPISPARANQLVSVNSAGDNLTTVNALDISTIPVSTFATTLLDDEDPNAGRITLGAQQSNVNLTALSNLTGAANKVARFTGAGTMELFDLALATETAIGTTFLPKQITISNNVTDTINDIDFSAGNFQFSDGTGIASLPATTKRLDASWTLGTTRGLFSGAKANSTWYHCFAIYNPTTGVSECGFDISPIAANRPLGFTKFKRVGSIRTDGTGNIILFFQVGNKFLYKTPILDANIIPAGTTRVNIPMSIPLGIRSFPIMNCWSTQSTLAAADRIVIFTTPDFTDITPTTSAFTFLLNAGTTELVDSTEEISNILSDTSSQIAYRASVTTVSFRLVTTGYIDLTL